MITIKVYDVHLKPKIIMRIFKLLNVKKNDLIRLLLVHNNTYIDIIINEFEWYNDGWKIFASTSFTIIKNNKKIEINYLKMTSKAKKLYHHVDLCESDIFYIKKSFVFIYIDNNRQYIKRKNAEDDFMGIKSSRWHYNPNLRYSNLCR